MGRPEWRVGDSNSELGTRNAEGKRCFAGRLVRWRGAGRRLERRRSWVKKGGMTKALLWVLGATMLAGAAHGQMTREELAGRFAAEARALSDAGVEYGTRWTPPGQGE